MSSLKSASAPDLKSINGGRKRSRSYEEEEEHSESDEGWLVSYADMMTLLCVFFLLMMVLSKPDPEKIEKVKMATATYFGGTYETPYSGLDQAVRAMIKKEGLEDQIQVTTDESGVSMMFTGAVFFESGSADILPHGAELLSSLSAIIKKEAPGYLILVEGHTDDMPISSKQFPSNWELSGNRAARVIRLFESENFDPVTLTGIGYSHTRPLFPNRDAHGKPIPQNQARNRRVVIKVMKNYEKPEVEHVPELQETAAS